MLSALYLVSGYSDERLSRYIGYSREEVTVESKWMSGVGRWLLMLEPAQFILILIYFQRRVERARFQLDWVYGYRVIAVIYVKKWQSPASVCYMQVSDY